jgi:hypothetical protein
MKSTAGIPNTPLESPAGVEKRAFVTAFLIRALEGIFALGLLGSSAVLMLTLIEDAKMLFESDKDTHRVIGETAGPPTMPVVATR